MSHMYSNPTILLFLFFFISYLWSFHIYVYLRTFGYLHGLSSYLHIRFWLLSPIFISCLALSPIVVYYLVYLRKLSAISTSTVEILVES